MKRKVILLAGLGLILLAGGWEISLAEIGESTVSPYVESTDSSMTPSLQERAEKNFTYIKVGPADPGKVGGEIFLGGLGAVVGGSICAFIGFGMGSEGSEGSGNGSFNFDIDEGGIIGALVGYAIGSNLGAATGVYVVGNSGGEKGSYWAGLEGSLLGTLVGGLCAGVIAKGSDDDSGVLPLFVLSAAQAGGAALCFNSTRKTKVEIPSGAMLNLKDGGLALVFPQINVSQDISNSNCFEVNFFEANF